MYPRNGWDADLAALIGEIDQPVSPQSKPAVSADRMVPIEHVSRNPRNPRRNFASGRSGRPVALDPPARCRAAGCGAHRG
jgi:hypothetical protein